jgi:hypothetical protein
MQPRNKFQRPAVAATAVLASLLALTASARADVYCDLAIEAVRLSAGSAPGLYHVEVDVAIRPGSEFPIDVIDVRFFDGPLPVLELSIDPIGISGGSCCVSSSQCPAVSNFVVECRGSCPGGGIEYECVYVRRGKVVDVPLAPGTVVLVVVDPDGAHFETCPEGLSNNAHAVVVNDFPQATCVGKTNSDGCVASVTYSGSPSLSSSDPFEIAATQALALKAGVLFYGASPATIPFQGGVLCTSQPVRRTPVQVSSGDPEQACSGVFTFDFRAWAVSGSDPSLVAGRRVVAQYWYRDPADPSGFATGLSNALDFTLWH